ncbi:hypothetical protein GCM10022419_061120 [Nonomuraea rosea]|uniref:Uncharacterized protein n=1 Tax=Nonomuraea rosea TaxID=638574 RepID=A0ABP6XYF2_9ACTN
MGELSDAAARETRKRRSLFTAIRYRRAINRAEQSQPVHGDLDHIKRGLATAVEIESAVSSLLADNAFWVVATAGNYDALSRLSKERLVALAYLQHQNVEVVLTQLGQEPSTASRLGQDLQDTFTHLAGGPAPPGFTMRQAQEHLLVFNFHLRRLIKQMELSVHPPWPERRSRRRLIWGFVTRQAVVILSVVPLLSIILDIRSPLPFGVRPYGNTTRLVALLLTGVVLLAHGLWAWHGRKKRHEAPSRSLLSRRSVVALQFTLFATLIVAPIAISFGRLSYEEFQLPPDCTLARHFDLRATASLLVKTDGQNVPTLISTVTYDLPLSSPIAGALLGHQRSRSFEYVLNCLALGRNDKELRRKPVSVVVANQHVRVADTVEAQVADLAEEAVASIGPWNAFINETTWSFILTKPEMFGDTRWQDITVKAPPGWLGTIAPDPEQADAAGAAWTTYRTGELVFVALHPDGRARSVAMAGKLPYSLVSWFSYELCGVAVLVWAYLTLRKSRTPDRPKPAALSVSVRVPTAVADMRRVRVLLGLTLSGTTILAVDTIAFQLVTDKGEWTPYWLTSMLSYTALCAVIALIGGISPTAVAGLACVASAFLIAALSVTDKATQTIYSGVPLVIVAWFAVGGVVSLLATAMRPPEWRGRPTASVLVIGAVLTVVTGLWYVALHTVRFSDQLGIAAVPESMRRLWWRVVWFPWETVLALDEIIWILPIIAMAALLKRRAKYAAPELDGPDRHSVIWLFCVSTMAWEAYTAGLWLPLSILVAAPVLSVLLTLSRRWVVLRRPLSLSPRPVDAPYEMARAVGPELQVGSTAALGGKIALALGLLPTAWFTWVELSGPHWDIIGRWAFMGIWMPSLIVVGLLTWFAAGFVLGLLWRELPGKISLYKSLPLVLAHAAGALTQITADWLLGQEPAWGALQRSLFIWAILIITGFGIEYTTMRRLSPGITLARFYGYEGRFQGLRTLAPQLLAVAFLVYAILRPEQGFIQFDPGQLMKR